jgi:hypothetical protein
MIDKETNMIPWAEFRPWIQTSTKHSGAFYSNDTFNYDLDSRKSKTTLLESLLYVFAVVGILNVIIATTFLILFL